MKSYKPVLECLETLTAPTPVLGTPPPSQPIVLPVPTPLEPGTAITTYSEAMYYPPVSPY